MTSTGKPFPMSYWFAPGCLVVGLANLCRAAYFWTFYQSVSSWMVGAGIGLTVVGLMATYYAWDDFYQRRHRLHVKDEEDVSVEEYEKRFEE